MIRTLIVEDEKYAREHLENLLREVAPDIEVLARFDSVSTSVAWLQENRPDLIFMDIQLADDLSFSIFEQVEVQAPVIFTTAYDQYAIKAFKANGIDYLMKPIDKDELQRSIQKYRRFDQKPAAADIQNLLLQLRPNTEPRYKERFMVTKGERVLSIPANQVAYFEGEDRYVFLVTSEGSRFIVDYKLSDLEHQLDPKHFFKLNRSFIANIKSITNIISVSKSRVKVDLVPPSQREIIVSTDNTPAFKQWLDQ